jgi:adenylate cyclase
VAGLVGRALDEQRVRTARALSLVRLAGVGAGLVLALTLAYGAEQSDWRVLAPIFGAWAAGALLLFAAVRRSVRAARWSGLGVALVDVPMVLAAQWSSLAVSPSPGGVAGFALGIFVLLVVLGALSLDARQLALVALASAVARSSCNARPASAAAPGSPPSSCSVARPRPAPTWWRGSPPGHQRHRRAAEARAAGALLLPVGGGAPQDRPGRDEPDAQEITVLFSDIREFTTLSGNLSPVEVVHMLNEYYAHMVEKVFQHGGRWTSSSATGSWPTSAPRWPTRTTRSTPSSARWRCSTSWSA